ncbi:MAG: Lsr2 family DNA-binding protein [Solirubrobacteraceae bacterium]
MSPKVVPALLDRAEQARNLRLSEGLKPLPSEWPYGDPLRVGDKVVVTGCYDHGRDAFERRAEALGARIIGSVSPKVAMLVSDDTMEGVKAARAAELGIRVVHPSVFNEIVEHIQPALPREERRLAAPREGRRLAAPHQPRAPKAERAAVGDAVILPEGFTPADVRQWGRENGWEVGVRGRLNQDLLAAFVAALSGQASDR